MHRRVRSKAYFFRSVVCVCYFPAYMVYRHLEVIKTLLNFDEGVKVVEKFELFSWYVDIGELLSVKEVLYPVNDNGEGMMLYSMDLSLHQFFNASWNIVIGVLHRSHRLCGAPRLSAHSDS